MMKFSIAALVAVCGASIISTTHTTDAAAAFVAHSNHASSRITAAASSTTTTTTGLQQSTAAAADAAATQQQQGTKDPLLIRAARGDPDVERTPVWMMRQAGRHMQCYRDLCKKYPTFRQRSEIPEAAVEISLQPYRAYNTDGCILFSDILTPFPGMGVEFEIDDKLGPVMTPMRSAEDVKKLKPIDPIASTPFVAEALKTLRQEVSPDTAVLGFVGCPYTLATYLVEGKTSKEYLEIKKMAMNEPQLLHSILQQLADNIGDYALYQIQSGAQLIQIFDSWAGHLSPRDYDEFAAPYQKQILDKIKAAYPDIPTVIYIKHSGALLERMASTGVDVVSLDWTVEMSVGRDRVENGRAAAGFKGRGGVQGNLDPAVLMASQDVIKERTHEILKQAGKVGHVMNLGHGIEAATSEENAHFFIDTVRNYRH